MHSNAVIIHTLTGLRFTQCPKCQERYVLSPGFLHGSHLCCKGCGENLVLQELSMGELENFKATGEYLVPTETWTLGGHKLEAGKTYEITVGGVRERDSTEADAAQALFVEFGFSSQWVIAECNPAGWGLVRYADFERWSQKQAAGKLTTLKEELTTRCLPLFGQPMVNWNLGERRASFTMCPPRLRFPIERPPVGGGKTAAMFGTVVHQAMDASQRNEKLKQELIRQYVVKAVFKLGASATLGVESDRQKRKQKEIKDQLAQNLKLIGCTYTEIGEVICDMVEALRNE